MSVPCIYERLFPGEVCAAHHGGPSPCPECRAGKHANCDGGAWDFERDEPCVCSCWEANHGGA